jgi:hypothetical protein
MRNGSIPPPEIRIDETECVLDAVPILDHALMGGPEQASSHSCADIEQQ